MSSGAAKPKVALSPGVSGQGEMAAGKETGGGVQTRAASLTPETLASEDTTKGAGPAVPTEVYPHVAYYLGDDGGGPVLEPNSVRRAHHQRWTLLGEEWLGALEYIALSDAKAKKARFNKEARTLFGFPLVANGPVPPKPNTHQLDKNTRRMFNRAYNTWAQAVLHIHPEREDEDWGEPPELPPPPADPPSADAVAPEPPRPPSPRKGRGRGIPGGNVTPREGTPSEGRKGAGRGAVPKVPVSKGVGSAAGSSADASTGAKRKEGKPQPRRAPEVESAMQVLKARYNLSHAPRRCDWIIAEAMARDQRKGISMAELAYGAGVNNLPGPPPSRGRESARPADDLATTLRLRVAAGVPARVIDAYRTADPGRLTREWVRSAAEGLAALAMVAGTPHATSAMAMVCREARRELDGTLGARLPDVPSALGTALRLSESPEAAPTTALIRAFGEAPLATPRTELGEVRPSDNAGFTYARAFVRTNCRLAGIPGANGWRASLGGLTGEGKTELEAVSSLTHNLWDDAGLGNDFSHAGWHHTVGGIFQTYLGCITSAESSAGSSGGASSWGGESPSPSWNSMARK
nr:MAG: hypothetical protein [Hubei toti-like virus 17]